jgi:hypothetical protein
VSKADILPWFPCEQTKLLGALSGMAPHVGYTYCVVILRCYESGGVCPDTVEALARRTGYTKKIVGSALDVLFATGKLVREASGIVNPYAATVIDGMKAHRQRLSAAGRSGGIHAGQKRKQNQTTPPSEATAPPQRGSSKSTLTEIKKESLFPSVTESAPPKAAVPTADWPKDYEDQFWRNYPRKTEKKAALSKLDAIRKSGTVRWAALIGGLLRFVQHCKAHRTEERYVKHPTTWLNRGCWDDEYGPDSPAPDGAPRGGGSPRSGGAAAMTRKYLETEMEAIYGRNASTEDD